MFTSLKISCSILFAACCCHFAQAQGITTPRQQSPAAMAAQKVGISTVTVNYSRPSVNKREVWGKLVPYGWNVQSFGAGNSAPWRAGANENTTLTLSHDATVQGQKVPAGTYGLFFVVNDDNTGEVVLSKDHKSWGSYWYDKSQDQLRGKIETRTIPHTELLTFDFINNTKTKTELVLNWEKKQLPVEIEFDVDNIVMANALDELKGPAGFSWQGFNSAAAYALNNNVNLDQAVKWSEQAIQQNKSFATLSIKSGLLKAQGNTAEAAKLMDEAMNMATEAEMNTQGYNLLAAGKLDEAVNIFVLNTKKYPNSANAFDSLGEAYVAKGDKKNAIASFKKSLSMNPPANVRANSEKFLKQLGAM